MVETAQTDATPGRSMVALDRTVAILRALESSPSPSLAQVARAAGLSDPTALRYLVALQHHELVERDPETGRYSLGIGLFRLGQRALGGRDPRRVALPYLERIRDTYGETVDFGMRLGDRLVLIEALQGHHSLAKGASVGDEDPWHSTSLGKAILARLPEIEARDLLTRRGCPAYTTRTLTSPDAVVADLGRVRELGYATDDEESEEGLRCVGAAVLDHRGQPSFAVSLSGPVHRLGLARIHDAGEDVVTAAAAISRELGYIAD